jgi:hypothetical protein
MAGIGQKLVWGLLGAATTRVTRNVTRRVLHNEAGRPKLPRRARRRNGLNTALLWAAGAGVVLAVSDVLREQQKDVADRA